MENKGETLMSELINCVEMTALNPGVIKSYTGKGVNTIRYYVGEVSSEDTFSINDVLPVVKEAVSLGMNWIMHLNMRNIITADGSAIPNEPRMFIRASERKIFEFVLNNLKRLAAENALPSILNAAINGATAENPKMKIMFYLSAGLDNEVCKKAINRFTVAGGRPFHHLSVDFSEKKTSDLLPFSNNISDLSRRFDKDIIIVETSASCTDEVQDMLIQHLANIPFDKGLGVIFSDKTYA